MPTRPCWEIIRPLLLEERPRASWMEALEFEQEAYGCTNKALPGEKHASLAWREVSRSQTNQSWIVLDVLLASCASISQVLRRAA